MSERVQQRARRAAGEPRQLDPDRLGSYVARLYRAAYGLCGDRQDAEDLVQDTYEQVLRRPRFIRNDQDLAYLLRVLRNTWTRSLRKHDPVASFAPGEDVEAVIDPRGNPADRAFEAQAVFEALRELSPRLRETVVAVDVVGLSYREAARAFRTKEGTIMSRLYRGRGQIAVLLGRTEPSAVSPET